MSDSQPDRKRAGDNPIAAFFLLCVIAGVVFTLGGAAIMGIENLTRKDNDINPGDSIRDEILKQSEKNASGDFDWRMPARAK